jgi:hypothetical protein
MATYKHLRSSTANKRPTTSIADGQLAINTNTASPGLFFKDSAGTGIVKVGPVHVGTTAPNSSPAGSSGNYVGEQWLDTSVSPAQMKVWNGTAWVGVVADELPVSKLQDGAARQLIQTDAAGTGVEWTSNVDVPGTLDVTSTATFDSIAQHPLGTAGAPTITFTGDTNTGIYSPGADQVAISTNGTGRLFVESNGRLGVNVSNPSYLLQVNGNTCVAGTADNVFFGVDDNTSPRLGIVKKSGAGPVFAAGSATSFIFSHSSGTDIASPAAQTYSERARIDSSGRLLVGTSSGVSAAFVNSSIQAHGITGDASSVTLYRFTTSATAAATPRLVMARSGSDSKDFTVVANGNRLGQFNFVGADGTQFISAASIDCEVDGTPGTNDMPGRLVLSVTLDGASSPTEALRITNDRVVAYNQPAPAAVNATATLTVANLKTGIITSTSAAATDMTLPTGTDTQAGFSGTYDNFTFEWSVINTGPSLVRVLAGTAHTVVGSGSVATGTSGRFASRRTAANTFVTYRLS